MSLNQLFRPTAESPNNLILNASQVYCDTVSNSGVLQVPISTVAQLPVASASNLGQVVFCSNGGGGNPILAFSSGSAWLRSDNGLAVAAS